MDEKDARDGRPGRRPDDNPTSRHPDDASRRHPEAPGRRPDDDQCRWLDHTLAAIRGTPPRLSGLAVVVADADGVVYEGCFGSRFIPEAGALAGVAGSCARAGGAPEGTLPVTQETKFRIASISKSVVGIGAMVLAERGLFDLDRDIADYLGFPLRNPFFPAEPITAAMLLSHTSSLRDGAGYSLPFPGDIRTLLLPGSPGFDARARFAAPEPAVPGRDLAPGRYFTYCNLGYGVIATAIERITGERFDRYMRSAVLGPLGLDAGYSVLDLSDSGFANLAPLYRKFDEEEAARASAARPDGSRAPRAETPDGADPQPEGLTGTGGSGFPWTPQVDDYRGKRPAAGCALAPGISPGALASYVPGTNGTLFSPQGGLRISARDLAKLMRLLMNGGSVDGVRLLSPAGVRRMLTPRWTFDPGRDNGDPYDGTLREAGLALFHTTDSRDRYGGDRLVQAGGVRLWGHHGSAYGLRSGMLFDPERKLGFVYLIGGTAAPPEANRGRFSTFALWEEEIQSAIVSEFWPSR